MSYTCPGLGLTQPTGAPPEGFVACYIAGHICPPAEAITEDLGDAVSTTWRCPCCGDFQGAMTRPKAWLS